MLTLLLPLLLAAALPAAPVGAPSIDAVSSASVLPEFFVEVMQLSDGDSVQAGSVIQAFGGPSWAVPSMELFVDGSEVATESGYFVSFMVDETIPTGTHLFKVEFICELPSCMGIAGSQSITLNITPPPSNPNPSQPSDDVPGPRSPEPGEPDEPSSQTPTNGQFRGGSACSAAGTNSTGVGILCLLGLLVPLRRRKPSNE